MGIGGEKLRIGEVRLRLMHSDGLERCDAVVVGEGEVCSIDERLASLLSSCDDDEEDDEDDESFFSVGSEQIGGSGRKRSRTQGNRP